MERKAFPLRIDSVLWSELESWAQDELRSVNGQIEYILREAVQKRKGRAKSRTQEGSQLTGSVNSGNEKDRPISRKRS
jgi:hypothetical protein